LVAPHELITIDLEGARASVAKRRRPGSRALSDSSGADSAYPDGIIPAMRTTIDKAGRLVIPAAARDRLGLTSGTTLEVSVDETGLRLERVAPGPQLVRIGKRLVARPTVSPDARPAVDVAALVEEERNRWP
jgi:AbrB family looped-hinge helix DNA binding protein